MWAWQAFYLGGSFQERQGLGLGEQGEGAARGASGLKGADARAQSEQEDDEEVHIELVEWLRQILVSVKISSRSTDRADLRDRLFENFYSQRCNEDETKKRDVRWNYA